MSGNSSRSQATVRLSVENLSKSFGAKTILREMTFTLDAGEMVAVVGPSGSGKSTLLNCLGLLEQPDSGAIFHNGRDIVNYRSRDARRYRQDVLGYLFQNYALIESATVMENLMIATRPHFGIGRTSARVRIAEALDQVGLAGYEGNPIHQLSGGEQQRVALARVLIKQPAIVLADEPTGALDQANADLVVGILHQLSGLGCAVAIATHNDSVRDRCDRVLHVASGLAQGASLNRG